MKVKSVRFINVNRNLPLTLTLNASFHMSCLIGHMEGTLLYCSHLDSLDLSSSPSICNVTLLSPFPRDFFKNAHVQTERGDIHQNETLYHSLMKGYQEDRKSVV